MSTTHELPLRYHGVVACALDGGIGIDGQMPWHLPADLARFRRETIGSPVLMGRRTWDQIGRPLPGRLCLVLSRHAAPANVVEMGADRVQFVTSLDEAEAAARHWIATVGPQPPNLYPEDAPALHTDKTAYAGRLCVVGGQQIYRMCASRMTSWHLTIVHAEGLGYDTWLDEVPTEEFGLVGRRDHDADARNAWAQTELWLTRRAPACDVADTTLAAASVPPLDGRYWLQVSLPSPG